MAAGIGYVRMTDLKVSVEERRHGGDVVGVGVVGDQGVDHVLGRWQSEV